MSAQFTPSSLLNKYRTKQSSALSSPTVKKIVGSNQDVIADVAEANSANNLNSEKLSQLDALILLEKAIDEVEQERQVVLLQQTDSDLSDQSPLKKPGINLPPLDQSPISSVKKEVEGSIQSSVEQGASVQVVEVEKSPELSPEVEKYLQEVHDDKDQAPKEIAIVDEIANLPTQNQFVSEPVIVLPITPEIQKKGKRKSPKYSIRWLVEWSQKIIKMFAGKVVYLENSSKE